MSRKTVSHIVIALIICISSACFASDKGKQETVRSYDILSSGKDIGDLTATREQGQNPTDLIVTSNLNIKLSQLIWNWDMSLDSRYEFSEATIKLFSHKLTENGKKSIVKGKNIDNIIQAQSNKKTSIDTKSFDATIEGLPIYVSKMNPIAPGTDIRLLDTQELTIHSYKVLEDGQAAITIGKTEYACRLLKFKTPVGNSSYWFAKDHLGVFVVKESGTDKDGTYAVVLKEYEKRHK